MRDILKFAGQVILMALAAAAFVMIVLPFNLETAVDRYPPLASRYDR